MVQLSEYTVPGLLIINILFTLWLTFFKSYFEQKGKNLATKNDIEEITEKVEGVKSELNVLTQTKVTLRELEIKYIEKISSQLGLLVGYYRNISSVLHITSTLEKIKNFENNIDNAWKELTLTFGTSMLFIEREEKHYLLDSLFKVFEFIESAKVDDSDSKEEKQSFMKYYIDYFNTVKKAINIDSNLKDISKEEENQNKEILADMFKKYLEFPSYINELDKLYSEYITQSRSRMKDLFENA